MTESIHALSGAYVVDALDDSERAAFEQHLPGCLDCQAEVAGLREAAVLMADATALPPPTALRDQVLSAISTVRPLPPAPAPTHEAEVVPLRRRRIRLALAAAAAAILAIAGIGALVRPWQHDTTSTRMSAADRVLGAGDAQHRTVTLADGSSATLVRSASQHGAVLVTRKMAAPPSGKVYELWMRTPQGAVHPAGTMSGGGDEKVMLDGDASTITWAGITVEPHGGSRQPTSKPIVAFDLPRAGA